MIFKRKEEIDLPVFSFILYQNSFKDYLKKNELSNKYIFCHEKCSFLLKKQNKFL